MDLECGGGLDDSVSTRLVVIGSRRLAVMAGRPPALDPAGRVSSRSNPMAHAQPRPGPQGTAPDGDQVADARVLRDAAAADEQRLGLDGRTTHPDPVPTHRLRRLLDGLWRQHQRGHGSRFQVRSPIAGSADAVA